MKTSVDVPPAMCPECGSVFDKASSMAEKQKPSPGDFTICLHCGALNKFGKDMRLVGSDLREALDYLSPMDVLRLLAAQAYIRRSKPKDNYPTGNT